MKTQVPTKILCCFCFACTGWSSWSSTHGQVQSLRKCDIASICQWCNNQSSAVTNVLIVVVSGPVTNLGNADSLLVFGVSVFHVELELTLPREALLVKHLIQAEFVNNISGVDINSDDCNDLDSEIIVQWSSDSLNQMTDSQYNHIVVVFHCCLTSTLMFIKGSASFFGPHDTSGQKSNLSTIVLKPYMSLFFKLPHISSLLGKIKDVSQGDLHFGLEIVQVVLDCTNSFKVGFKWDTFAFI